MTTTNGGVKNADTAGAPPPPSNFDLYAGDFSCDDDISFENLLQLDNDIDKPQPSTLHQSTASPTSAHICRQTSINAAQPSSIAGSETDVPVPTADTVVYLLTTTALRPPNSAVAAGYDTVARNNVRPLLRFQISKKPTTTAVPGYGIELGGPVVAAASTSQQRAPAALSLQTAPGCNLTSITSMGDRVAALPARCPPVSTDPRCLTLTSAFNGELPMAAQRSLAAAGALLPGTRPSKSTHHPTSSVSGSKSRSAAAADARQTVQEKNAYEYERVMDILRYYRELVVERKLPGACLPCKRRKSKPLVSADTVTPTSTRSAPPPSAPPSTAIVAARSAAVPASQYVRTVAMSTWRGPTAPVLCLTTSGPVTAAGKLTTTNSSISVPTTRPIIPNSRDDTAMTTTDQDATDTVSLWALDSAYDELPSRPSSVELGTARSHSLEDNLLDCSKDFTRTCRSAPGMCDDADEPLSPSTTGSEKTTLECRRPQFDVFNRSRRHRTLRRSVDLRRLISRTSAVRKRDPGGRQRQTAADSDSGQINDETTEVSVWVKPVAMLPVKDITTRTTDTVVVKWTKAHLAISGPYQSWT